MDAPPALHVEGSTITQFADAKRTADNAADVVRNRRMRTCWLRGPKVILHRPANASEMPCPPPSRPWPEVHVPSPVARQTGRSFSRVHHVVVSVSHAGPVGN